MKVNSCNELALARIAGALNITAMNHTSNHTSPYRKGVYGSQELYGKNWVFCDYDAKEGAATCDVLVENDRTMCYKKALQDLTGQNTTDVTVCGCNVVRYPRRLHACMHLLSCGPWCLFGRVRPSASTLLLSCISFLLIPNPLPVSSKAISPGHAGGPV